MIGDGHSCGVDDIIRIDNKEAEIIKIYKTKDERLVTAIRVHFTESGATKMFSSKKFETIQRKKDQYQPGRQIRTDLEPEGSSSILSPTNFIFDYTIQK